MFRWHSTVVEPSKAVPTSRDTTSAMAAQSAAVSSPPKQPDEEWCVSEAHARIQMVGEAVKRNPDGSLANGHAFLRSVEEAAGVRFGPQGGGTLLAIADKRRPTREEVKACLMAPGSKIVGRPQPMARSGRGLGHLHGSSNAPPQKGKGAPFAGGRGTGGRGPVQVQATAGRGRGASVVQSRR